MILLIYYNNSKSFYSPYSFRHLMTKKTEVTKIVTVGTDNMGQQIRFIVDSKGTATRIDHTEAQEPKSALTGMNKFLAYCQKQKLDMATYRINKIVFCRVIKGELVKGSRGDTSLFSAFMAEHNLGTLKIGSGIKFQNVSLMYSKDEISDLKTFANLHIAESFRV